MGQTQAVRWGHFPILAAGILALALAGCSGDDGAQGPPGPAGIGVTPASSATTLDMTITGVAVASPPVVNFRAANEVGTGAVGLTLNDLRFTIAKLVPGTDGNPSRWQNYINRVSGGNVQATREGGTTGTLIGTLVDHGDGSYTYTFKTDITDVACPSPCEDADGNALDLSYNPELTHRVAIQTRGALPMVNAVHTFRPADGATTGLFSREIIKTAKCNECHNKLTAHDARIDTQYCVMCHNPGTTASGKTGVTSEPTTVDFKVMIHKIHRGEHLPSVQDIPGGDYGITGFSGSLISFNTVVFPQDIRNCAKCHDGADAATPQGHNWKTQPSIAACGSCHDDVYFGASPAKPYQTRAHPGGVVSNNAECTTCHAADRIAGSVEERHALPSLQVAESAKFQFNILEICGTPVDANPVCAPGTSPVVKFSVTDPTNGDAPYDIKTDTRITGGSLTLALGWNTTDSNNAGSNSNPGLPVTVNLLGANAVAAGGNTYTVDFATATLSPGTATNVIPLSVTGSGRFAMYGRTAVDVDGNGTADRVRVKAAFEDFGITDPVPVPRRQVVDIAKCDKCHQQLSLHGDSRTDEPGLCVMCHNPVMTDVNRRPKSGGIPNPAATPDNKKEESIDFKRLIHGIHSAAKTDYTGAAADGFREKGLVVYGFNSTLFDFSHVRFPGILNDCTTCHLPGTYELAGNWQVPTQSGVLGSSIDTAPNAVDAGTFTAGLADQTDDLNITPTAAVCSSCHDGTVAKSHMELNGALFSATQATINTGATLEACAICHGPGRVADVKVMHRVP